MLFFLIKVASDFYNTVLDIKQFNYIISLFLLVTKIILSNLPLLDSQTLTTNNLFLATMVVN